MLTHWSGLGYYARGRNLHKAAQTDRAISMPECSRARSRRCARCPASGRSTAAAICVFAYGARHAILDGNVKRVLARHYGIDGLSWRQARARTQLWAQRKLLLPQRDLEAYTQGLMDLGAACACARNRVAAVSRCVEYLRRLARAIVRTGLPARAARQSAARAARRPCWC